MKHKTFRRLILSLLVCTILLTLSLCVPAFAEDELSYVTDLAGLLTGEEAAELERQARKISELYDCGVYIVTVEDFTEYADTDDVAEAAQEIYLSDENSFGMGGDKSGVLLLLSMAERDFCLYAYGYGNTAFTDYGKDRLAESFVDDFGDNDWYGGFEDYLEVSGELLKSARNGSPIDKPEPPNARIYGVLACILLGFSAAFIVKRMLLGQLRSVKKGTEAGAFVAESGLRLTEKYDMYTHTTQTRIYDPPQKKSSRSSGGGGTTVNSRGGSSRSGKF